MKKIKLLALAVLTMFAYACNTDDPLKTDKSGEEGGQKQEEEIPQPADATNLKVTFSDGSVWGAGDSFGVFECDGLGYAYTTSEKNISNEGKTAIFTGEKLQQNEIWAVYPYRENDILIGEVVSTLIPFNQPQSGWKMAVAHAKDSKELVFYDALPKIAFSITDTNVKEVVIKSNDNKAYLAGTADITIGDNGATNIEITDGVPFVVLTPDEGKETIEPGAYLIACAPAVLTKGLSIRVKEITATEGGDDLMFVNETTESVSTGETVLDLGSLNTSSYKRYIEKKVTDDAAGIPGWYREFGTESIATSPRNIFYLGDYDLSTCWAMPSSVLNGGKGDCYLMDGTKSIRGSYLRLQFSTASGGNAHYCDSYFFEYSIPYEPENVDRMYGMNFAPWTLRLQDYNVATYGYGVLKEWTVEADNLPWTYEYNNRFVSDKITRELYRGNTKDTQIKKMILCCTRTRKCEFEPQPKDALDGVEFMDLLKETPDYQWGLSELHIWLED